MNADGPATAARVLAVLDLTSLGEDDTTTTIAGLYETAASGRHPVAVCVYPEHIETARRVLDAQGAAVSRRPAASKASRKPVVTWPWRMRS